MIVNAQEIRAWTVANRLARVAEADREAEDRAPKTARRSGTGVGICERCGIDTTNLRGQKCNACRNYLWRRAHRIKRVRECPTCTRPHAEDSRTCAACRQRAYRQKTSTNTKENN